MLSALGDAVALAVVPGDPVTVASALVGAGLTVLLTPVGELTGSVTVVGVMVGPAAAPGDPLAPLPDPLTPVEGPVVPVPVPRGWLVAPPVPRIVGSAALVGIEMR